MTHRKRQRKRKIASEETKHSTKNVCTLRRRFDIMDFHLCCDIPSHVCIYIYVCVCGGHNACY